MKKFNKILLSVVMLLALTIMPVLAASVTVTWEWLNLDPEVTAFRYQLDGEEEGNWTVVDAFVTSYEANGLDSNSEYTLFLQQSYDGINWSASASATSYPLEEVEDDWQDEVVEEEWIPEVVEEDPLFYTEDGNAIEIDNTQQESLAISFELEEVVDEVAEVEAEVEEIAAEEVVTEEPVEEVAEVKEPKVKQVNDFKFSFLLSAGMQYDLGKTEADRLQVESQYKVLADIGLGFDNIIKVGKSAGIGLQINAGGVLTFEEAIQTYINEPAKIFKLESYNKALSADALINFAFNGKSNMFIIGAGATGLFRYQPATAARFDLGGFGVDLGAKASLQYRQFIGKTFSIGLDANYTYMFVEAKHVQYVGAKLSFGLSF